MKNCQFCNKEYTPRGVAYHEKYCAYNPNKSMFNSNPSDAWRLAMANMAKSGASRNQWTKARENGTEYVLQDSSRAKMKEAGIGRTLTEETKNKIRIGQLAHMEAHPDDVGWKRNHHAKGPSYPEIYWKTILDNHNISYEAEYGVGIYSLDFALPDKMIDFEVDGEQHYNYQPTMDTDARRTPHLENLGWEIIRVRWSSYSKLNRTQRELFVENIIDKLTASKA